MAAAVAGAAKGALTLDRSKLEVSAGLRTATGVAIPLIVGLASGHTLAGVTACIGALSGGFASLQGTYRSRAGIVLAAAGLMAGAAFVGATVGPLFGVDIVVTALMAFGAGLVVVLGQAAIVIAIQAIVGLVVFSQFSFGVAQAATDAGFVLLGGAVQALLVVILWPVSRFPAERRALSRAFDQLGLYAGSLAVAPTGLLDRAGTGAFEDVRRVLRDPQPFARGPETIVHQALLNQADRIRLELVALARAHQRLESSGERAEAGAIDEVLQASGRVLGEVAAALRDGRVPLRWADERTRFEAALVRLRRPPVPAAEADRWRLALRKEAAERAAALAGQLRSVVRIAAIPAGGNPALLEEAAITGGPVSPAAAHRAASDLEWAREQLSVLRANLTLSSEACRHALRLAGAMAVAVALSHLFGPDHRYWVPMTVMLVLRPDFTSTLTRGVARIAGTLLGAGVVTVLLAELRPGPGWLAGIVIVLCWAATALLLANYALYSVCIASLVVTLVAFTGQPEVSVAGERALYTAIGAAIALVAYFLWPTWAATSLPAQMGDLVAVEGRYARGVLSAWADPAAADRAALQRDRLDARVTRTNAEAAVDRWLAEPARPGALDRDTVLGMVAAVHNCVEAVLTLHARLPRDRSPDPVLSRDRPADGVLAGDRPADPVLAGDRPADPVLAGDRPADPVLAGDRPADPVLRTLADQVGASLDAVAATIRGGRPAGSLAALRETQLALADRLVGDGAVDADAVSLVGETDLLVNSINTLGHLAGLDRSAPVAGRGAGA